MEILPIWKFKNKIKSWQLLNSKFEKLSKCAFNLDTTYFVGIKKLLLKILKSQIK